MKNSEFVWSAVLATGGIMLGLVLLCVAPFAVARAIAAR
jgi:hypothetical protein